MSNFHVCYCFPKGDQHLELAYRFLNSYLLHPAQVDHELILLTDYGNESEAEEIFSVVPGVKSIGTPDYAKDLSRYEAYAQQCSAACMMMLGGTSYCNRSGWGLRAMAAFQRLGNNAIYGACGHTGAAGVHKHIRTTGWWASPELLRRYPYWPKTVDGRYAAEHGNACITAWAQQNGYRTWVVTFSGEYPVERAQDDPNGYARGNQSNILIGDRLAGPGPERCLFP